MKVGEAEGCSIQGVDGVAATGKQKQALVQLQDIWWENAFGTTAQASHSLPQPQRRQILH